MKRVRSGRGHAVALSASVAWVALGAMTAFSLFAGLPPAIPDLTPLGLTNTDLTSTADTTQAIQAPYAAGIPWLETQAACERTGRTWEDETCWDTEHNAMF